MSLAFRHLCLFPSCFCGLFIKVRTLSLQAASQRMPVTTSSVATCTTRAASRSLSWINRRNWNNLFYTNSPGAEYRLAQDLYNLLPHLSAGRGSEAAYSQLGSRRVHLRQGHQATISAHCFLWCLSDRIVDNRDGVIEAKIDHENGWLSSHELVDLYSTEEPQRAFHKSVTPFALLLTYLFNTFWLLFVKIFQIYWSWLEIAICTI